MCVCVCVCVCVCAHTGVYIHAHVQFVKTVREIRTQISASGTSPVCVCACACVCVCVFVCVYVCVYCDKYGVRAIYITMQVCSCTLCEYSVRNKNPKSLQVVQAQSVCVCVSCVCAQLVQFMHNYTL